MYQAIQFIKSLVVKAEGLTGAKIAVSPAGAPNTTTTITSSQTVNRTITLPDSDTTLVGQQQLDAHINDPTDAHMASAIGVTPAGGIVATNVQAALVELDTELEAHITDPTNAHAASAIGVTPVGGVIATDVQAAIAELDSEISGSSAGLAAHIANPTGAHAASAISVSPTGNLVATNAQAALAELDSDLTAHITQATGAHAGTAISITPGGNLVATNAQAAVIELDSDLTAHVTNSTGAHAASAISVIPSGSQTQVNVQAAINYLASAVGSIGVLANNVFLKWRNAGNTADIDVLALNSSNNVVLQNPIATNSMNITTAASNAANGGNINLTTGTGTGFQSGGIQLTTGNATGASAGGINIATGTGGSPVIQLASPTVRVTAGALQPRLALQSPNGNSVNLRTQVGTNGYDFSFPTTAGANGQVLSTDGTGLTSWTSAAGGGAKNLIPLGDAEGANPIGIYQSSLAAVPSGGLSTGSGSQTTAISATSPLEGNNSFIFTKTLASTQQGYGWFAAFTTPTAYTARTLTASFDYVVNSGTFVAATTSTDSDVTVYIWDFTNNVIVPLSNSRLYSNSTTIPGRFEATFQVPATGTSYGLLFHIATTSTATYSLKVDNIAVSPSAAVYGTPATEWQSYNPSVGTTVTNMTPSARWRRVGSNIEVQGSWEFTGTPAAFGGVGVNLPAGLSFDTTKFAPTVLSGDRMAMPNSTAVILDSGNRLYPGSVNYLATGAVQIYAHAATAATGPVAVNQITNAYPFSWGANDILTWSFTAPIAGWAASVQMSDRLDARITSLKTVGVGGSPQLIPQTTLNNPVVVTILTATVDTHAAWASNTYTVPVAGLYEISVYGYFSNLATSLLASLGISVNSTSAYTESAIISGLGDTGQTTPLNFETTLQLNAGDVIRFMAGHNGTGNRSFSSDNTRTRASITRVTGPQAIGATDTIVEIRENRAGTVIGGSPVILPFATPIKSTHNSWDATNHRFYAPAPGTYSIDWMYQHTNNNASSPGEQFVRKNGTIIIQSTIGAQPTNATINGSYGDRFQNAITFKETMNQGDYLDFQSTATASAGSIALIPSLGYNRISISRIGL